MSHNPYSSPQGKDPLLPIKLAAKMYTSSTPTTPFVQTNTTAVDTRVTPIVQTIAPIGDYDRIKSKIDQGVKMQTQGEDLVAEGLREMVETKAYRQKGYKTIAAFAEHEYRQTRDWVYGQIRNRLPSESLYNAECGERHKVPNATPPTALRPLRQEEPEKPHIRTADEIKAEQAKLEPRKAVTENGKPKYLLAVWRELQDAYGRALNRIDEANRACPDKTEHDELISITKQCMRRADQWHERCKRV